MRLRLAVLAVTTALTTPAVRGAAQAGGAPPRGALVGTVTDSATGRPLPGAKVAVLAGRPGREATDSAGRYRLAGIAFPEVEFELHCPSRTMLGKSLLMRRVRVPLGRATRLDWRVDATLCDEPAPSVRHGVWTGRWVVGFETSEFVPCLDSARAPYPPTLYPERLAPVEAWADFPPRVRPPGFTWPEPFMRVGDNPAYYVRWRGTLRGPGQFGHLGASAYGFAVDSLLDVRAWGGSHGMATCTTPP